MVFCMHHLQCRNHSLAIFYWFTYFWVDLKSKHVSTLLVKLHFIILICWVCWPWIILKRLSQVVKFFLGKTFLSMSNICCNLASVQVVRKHLISNLCLELYISFFLLLTCRSPSLAKFNKNVLDVDIVTWSKWTIQLKICIFWLLPKCSPKENKLYLFNDTKL
jgi:hypothetical protein